jgi:hypothetical protein
MGNLVRLLELAGISSDKLLIEGFKEKRTKWIKLDPKLKVKDIDVLFEKFKEMKNKSIIKGKEADIDSYKTFADLEAVIKKNKGKKSKRAKVNNATMHVNADGYRVVEPHSFEASCKYGGDTEWCVSTPSNDTHWKSYKAKDIRFIYVQDFENDEKYAIAVYPHAKGDKPAMEAFNKEDNTVSPGPIISKYKIPKKALSNVAKPKTWAWFITHVGEKNVKVSGDKIDVMGDVNLSNMGLSSLQFDD